MPSNGSRSKPRSNRPTLHILRRVWYSNSKFIKSTNHSDHSTLSNAYPNLLHHLLNMPRMTLYSNRSPFLLQINQRFYLVRKRTHRHLPLVRCHSAKNHPYLVSQSSLCLMLPYQEDLRALRSPRSRTESTRSRELERCHSRLAAME